MGAARRMTVLNVELSTPYSVPRIDDDIAAALAICRMHGKVAGQFEAAVENGCLSDQALQTHLPGIAWNAWNLAYADFSGALGGSADVSSAAIG